MDVQVAPIAFLFLTGLALGSAAVNSNTLPLSSGNTDFAFNLYRSVIGKANGGNVFMSPISISTALAMTYAGTKGQTKLQMAKVLKFEASLQNDDNLLHTSFKNLLNIFNDPTNNYTLQLANRLFSAKNLTLLSKFLQDTKKNYYAEAQALDFAGNTEASRLHINDWVANQTNDKIKDLIKSGMLSSNTLLVLVNCIYFKGLWKLPFDKSETKKDKFYLSSGSQVDMDMMNIMKHYNYKALDSLNSKILEIPYGGDEISMYILLPNDKNGLSALEAKVTRSVLDTAIQSMALVETKLTLPKFTLTQEISLSEILKQMGMSDLFGEADLSGMFGRKGPSVSAVIHKAFVQVDEEGTEAAAATAVIVDESAPAGGPNIFKVDRPFLFLIREKATGSTLFLGRITKPAGTNGEPPIDAGPTNGSPSLIQFCIYIVLGALGVSGLVLQRLI